MSESTNSVVEQARKAALVFINHDLPSLAVARGDAEMACDAVMRVLLTELRTTAQAQEGRTEAYEAVMDQIDSAIAELGL